MSQFKNLKLLSISLLAFLLTACGGEEVENLDQKVEKLNEHKKEMSDLQLKIDKLENEIIQLDSNNSYKLRKRTLVKTGSSRVKTFTHYVEISGTAYSKKNIRLSSETSGLVEKVYFSEGDEVKKGDLIVKLDDELLQRNIDEILTSLELARKVYNRQKNLWDQKIGSEIQYLEAKNQKESLERRLKSARSQLDKTEIKAPIEGQIDNFFINEGELANPGTPIVRIVNLSNMRIKAEVSEAYLGKLEKGDTVLIELPSLDISKHLPITFVGNYVDPGSRSFIIEIKLNNDDKKIKPNLLAKVKFVDYKKPKSLVIPTKLIQEERGEFYVFTAKRKDGEWVANKSSIEKGYSSSGETEIISGLKPKDLLVVQGYRDIDDGELLELAKK